MPISPEVAERLIESARKLGKAEADLTNIIKPGESSHRSRFDDSEVTAEQLAEAYLEAREEHEEAVVEGNAERRGVG